MLYPRVAHFSATLADAFFELVVNAIGYQEFCVRRPAVEFLGKSDFFLAQRFAVGFLGVLTVGSAPADVAVDDNQRWFVGGVAENIERLCHCHGVIGIGDMLDIPAITFETCADIFAECQAGVAFDGDVIVIVDPAKIGQLMMSGQRGSFARNSFHHVAVAADGVHVVIK